MPRRPSPQPGPGSTSYLDRVRWVEVSNENAEDAPGGALLMVTGGGTDDGDSADDYGVPTVDQPDADGLTGLLVAHPAGIAAGGRGLATSDDFVPVAYDDADTPAVGETWGSAAGSWLLTKDMAGWRVAAPAVASQDLKLVECWRATTDWFIAQLTSGVSPYSWQERVETAAGVWADGPRSGTADAYQAQPSAGTPTTPAENDLVLLRASPTVAGVYEFVATGAGPPCAGLPFMHKVMVGVDFTGSQVRYRVRSVDANGCETLGPPVCETGATCSETEDMEYWCIGGVCWTVYDGLTPADADAGPFATPELCAAGCPVAPGGTITCCDPDLELAATLYLPLSGGNGTLSLVWDGSTYWQSAAVVLPCGETVEVRFGEGCVIDSRTNGGAWTPGTVDLFSLVCAPFSLGVSLTIGGGCGTLTGTLSE